MRRPDYDRRVAITGLGVISPIGNDIPTVWHNLSHGVSGLAELTRFDVSRYEHKWGGEVKDFNASDWMDPKHARRTESSVHFGVAAAKQALADSGLEITDANREEVGVIFSSGAGGQGLMIDSWISLHDKGPAERRADVHRQRPRRLDVGPDRDRNGRDRPQPLHRVGLRHRHPQRRRGGRGDPARRLHRGHRRLDRGAAARGGSRRLHEHARDGQPRPGEPVQTRLAGRST